VTPRILRTKKDEMVGGWRNIYNVELLNIYSLPNIISMIRSRRVRWSGHVARMGQKLNYIGF
jgi:hypothetical protein